MVAGRPRKYNDSQLVPVPLNIPEAFALNLKSEANRMQISVNEYCNGLLVAADKKLAEDLILHMKEIREDLQIKNKAIQAMSGELMNLRENSMSASKFLIGSIENDKEINSIVDPCVDGRREQYKAMKKNVGEAQAIETASKLVLEDVQLEYYKTGRIIKKPEIMRSVIKSRILAVA